MLQAEYIRDMHNNYLVIKGEENHMSSYGIKMLLNNTIQGILKVELRSIDQMNFFYYDITSKKSISALYDNKALNYVETKNLLFCILDGIDRSGEYLLSEDDFVLDSDFIFLDPELRTVSLCHIVGYQESIQKQLIKLIEYLMNKVDYKDEKAVLLIYEIYKESREDHCTFDLLMQKLRNKQPESEMECLPNKHTQINQGTEGKNKTIISGEKGSKINVAKENDIYSKNTKINHDKVNHVKENDVKANYKKTKDIKTKITELFAKDKGNHDSITNTRNKYPTPNNLKDIRPTIYEEIENEREILYYDPNQYILALISSIVGIALIGIALQSKLLRDSFGSHIDVVKLICFILIILSSEIFIMTKIFNKNNRSTRMETDIEYSEQSQEVYVLDGPVAEKKSNEFQTQKNKNQLIADEIITDESITEETQILWRNNTEEEGEQEKTIILANLLPQKQFYLEAVNSMDKERIQVRTFPFIIGKTLKEVNHIIEDSSVSRKHAKITKEGETYYIKDLCSTNGTYLNGEKLLANKYYQVNLNDELSFSNFSYYWKESK